MVDGAAAASWYGLRGADTVYYYQGGRDPRHRDLGVGSVLMGMMIRRAIEVGARRFDMLRGDEAYKARWTDSADITRRLVALRPSVWGWVAGGLALGGDVTRVR